jgi:outer membrane beta-barrel protein
MTRLSEIYYELGAFRRRLAPLLAVAALTLGATRAGAAEPEETDTGETPPEGEPEEVEPEVPTSDLESLVRVVQQRPVLKAGRFELLAGAGLVVNDDMYTHWLATATGRVHISEWISIGATYAKYFSEPSGLRDTVTQDFEVFPELSATRWYAGGDVTFVAIEGKFVFFDDVISYWDIYASIGGGVTVTSRSDDPKPTGMIGVGLRMYLTDWLTLTFELRDHMFIEEFNAGNEFVNNVVGQAGLTLFIPFGFDYEYAK